MNAVRLALGTPVQPTSYAVRLWPAGEQLALQRSQRGRLVRYERPKNTTAVYAVIDVAGKERWLPAGLVEPVR